MSINDSVTNVALHDGSDLAAALALVQRTAQQAILPRNVEEGYYAINDTDGSIQIVETPGHKNEREFKWAEAHADTPTTLVRTVRVSDVASFLHFLAATTTTTPDSGFDVGTTPRWGAGLLEVWANLEDGTVTGIVNGGNGWGNQRCILQLEYSREWAQWAKIDGKLLDQEEFAMFIEDHLSNIASPDGALLLEICQTLQGTVGAKFAGRQILKDGSRTVHWEETTEASAGAKGDLKIPDSLILALRPYQGSNPIRIDARFRFRPIPGGGIKIGVKLNEPELVLEQAFSETVNEVDELIPVPVLMGY